MQLTGRRHQDERVVDQFQENDIVVHWIVVLWIELVNVVVATIIAQTLTWMSFLLLIKLH